MRDALNRNFGMRRLFFSQPPGRKASAIQVTLALGLNSTRGRTVTDVAEELGLTKQAVSRGCAEFLRMPGSIHPSELNRPPPGKNIERVTYRSNTKKSPSRRPRKRPTPKGREGNPSPNVSKKRAPSRGLRKAIYTRAIGTAQAN